MAPTVETVIAGDSDNESSASDISIEAESEDSGRPNTEVCCCNCRRRRPNIESVTKPYKLHLYHKNAERWKHNKCFTRKFCLIDFKFLKQTNNWWIYACQECCIYLDADTSRKAQSQWMWPAFLWLLLADSDLFELTWRYLPECWRPWWLQSVCLEHGLPTHDMHVFLQLPSLFVEISDDMKADLAALQTLQWTDIMKREESLALPTVKCPVGCTEWKHKCNNLPFDIVLEHYLGVQINLYSDPSLRKCCNSFRDDYFYTDQLIYNKKWLVRPSIVIDEKGVPVVLSCRHHDTKSQLMMVHPCRSPSGTIATEKSNQFCPAVAIPRTLRRCKAHAYSASFQMATLEGTYHGLDTMYLTTDGGNYYHQYPISWKQEVLAYKGRRDIKAHVHRLWNEKKLGDSVLKKFDEDFDICYPNHSNWNALRAEYDNGGTFMSIDDACKLQQTIHYEGIESVTCKPDRVTGKEKIISFTGAWPKHIAWIHPAGNKYGRAFPDLIPFGLQGMDSRAAWLLCAILATVPTVWTTVAATQKREDSWEGWGLTAVAKYCFPHKGFRSSRSNPFGAKLSYEKFFTDFVQSTKCQEFDIKNFATKFKPTMKQPEKYKNIMIAVNAFPSAIEEKIDIILILHDENYDNTATETWQPTKTSMYDEWELVFITFTEKSVTSSPNSWKGTIYCRYGGTLHPYWWNITRGCHKPCQVSSPIEDLIHKRILSWTASIYLHKKKFIQEQLRDQLLSTCGGQTKVYCGNHDYPMICIPNNQRYECCCPHGKLPLSGEVNTARKCNTKAQFVCPSEGCTNAICTNHHISVLEGLGPYYVTDNMSHCHYRQKESSITQHRYSEYENDSTNNSQIDVDDDINYDMEAQNMVTLNSSAQHYDTCPVEASFCIQDKNEDEQLATDKADRQDIEAFFSSVNEELIEECFVTGDNETNDPMMNYLTDDEDTTEQYIPTTDAGVRPMFSEVIDDVYTNNNVSNHVILNHFGSCLIRRNRDMSGTLRQKAFLQGLVAKSFGESVPLLYPEGMLFTDQFYCDANDGSTIGAISAGMLHNDQMLRMHGISSLQDHFRSRLSNAGLLASANPKYHFWAFDNLVNLGMRGCDSRIVLRRGFAENQKTGGVCIRDKKLPIFDTQQIDCRPVVNKLAAAIAEEQPTYFYTHTCSMRTHFGIKLIWEWMMSDDILDEICVDNENEMDRSEIRRNIIDSTGVLLLRAWMELMHIWILYITKSPDCPIGVVTKHFFRMELQDAQANLPHMHAIIWTKDNLNSPEGLQNALDRIRGYIEDILRPDEKERFIQEGIFSNETAVIRFLEMMGTMLQHKHLRRCYTMVKNKDTDGETQHKLVCKVPNNYVLNNSPTEHTFCSINVEHSQEMIHVMQVIGLAKPPPANHKEGEKLVFEPLHKRLKSEKHIPPAHGNEGIISPVSGELVARNPNASNIQFTSGFLLSRYLAKYVASIDDYNVIRIKPPDQDDSIQAFKIEGELQINTKITGNRIFLQKKRKLNKNNGRVRKEREARAINVAETYMLLFGYDSVMTNIEFQTILSQPYEERASKERRPPLQRILERNEDLEHRYLQNHALSVEDVVPCHHVRKIKQYPEWRQFTENQLKMIEDDLQSPVTTDTVTIFSLRPPELTFVMEQNNYFRWFKRASPKTNALIHDQIRYCCGQLHDTHLNQSSWLDATNARVRIRMLAIKPLKKYLIDGPLKHFSQNTTKAKNIKRSLQLLFQSIDEAIYFRKTGILLESTRTESGRKAKEKLYTSLLQRYVCEHNALFLPTIWYHSIRPTQTNRFLIHILLTMGSFVDEYSLFNQASLRDSFIQAGLLTNATPIECAQHLTKRYIMEQLLALPAGSITFDKYCVAAYNGIKSLFEDGTFYTDEIPTVLYCRLADETAEKVKEYKISKRTTVVTNLLEKLYSPCSGHIPNIIDCVNAKIEQPIEWDPTTLPKSSKQPQESYDEQQKLLQITKERIQHYISAQRECTQNICVVGAGGVGKTTVNQISLLYAICCGLNADITALMSERSQELGSEHLNSLFCMPRGEQLTPAQLAERCISALYKYPEKLEFLRTLDVLLLDETGNIPAEILSVMDIVLRYVRNSNKPYSGILILATMDNLQIDPCTGRHPLMSSLFISMFTFFKLTASVRAADDQYWQRIQTITRLQQTQLKQPSIKNEFVTLLMKHAQWIHPRDAINLPPNALFVFGKNQPIRMQEKILLERLCKNKNKPYIISHAEDHERNVEGRLIKACEATSNMLNKKVKEPQKLYLYKGGRYQITANKKGQYSNSQLAILFKLPSDKHIKRKLPLKMLIAPPGCRYIPGPDDTEDSLRLINWIDGSVHTCNDKNVHNIYGSIRATRLQYCLRHHVGSTLHSIMGQTLAKLITRIDRGRKSPYSLWLASQIIVLLSRTRYAQDTIFISENPTETATTVYEILLQTTPFRQYISDLLERLCCNTTNSPIHVNYGTSIFRPRDISLPRDGTGQVYLLISLQDLHFLYIGSTRNLGRRYCEHNSGFSGSLQTSSTTLRPWALLAYVTGFKQNTENLLQFENAWIATRHYDERDRRIHVTAQHLIHIAKDIIVEFKNKGTECDLCLVECGTIEHLSKVCS